MDTNLKIESLSTGVLPEVASLCHRAYADIEDHLRFRRDAEFPANHFRLFRDSAGIAEVLKLMINDSDHYGVCAWFDGALAGCGFLSLFAEYGIVGPVAVDPRHQGKGVGHAICDALIEHAAMAGQTPLLAFADQSSADAIAIAVKAGFDVKGIFMLMNPSQMVFLHDTAIRPIAPSDIVELTTTFPEFNSTNYRRHISLRSVRALSAGEPLLYQRNGEILGYIVPGPLGQGACVSDDVAYRLIKSTAADTTADIRFACPLIGSDLFRRLTVDRCEPIRQFTLLIRGPYVQRSHLWMPGLF